MEKINLNAIAKAYHANEAKKARERAIVLPGRRVSEC